MIVFMLLLPIAGVVWPASRAHVSLFWSNLLSKSVRVATVVLRKTGPRGWLQITLHYSTSSFAPPAWLQVSSTRACTRGVRRRRSKRFVKRGRGEWHLLRRLFGRSPGFESYSTQRLYIQLGYPMKSTEPQKRRSRIRPTKRTEPDRHVPTTRCTDTTLKRCTTPTVLPKTKSSVQHLC